MSVSWKRLLNSRALIFAASLFLILRLCLSLLGYWGIETYWLPPNAGGVPDTRDVPRVTNPVGYKLLGIWQRWDALWYQKLATHGYETDPHSTAFFPLFPMLLRAFAWLFHGQYVLAGLFVSGIAFIAAMAMLYKLASLDLPENQAARSLLYISIFPTAFFFFCSYTESLFLMLSVGAFLAARKGRWWLASLAGFLAALTRGPGVLLALPLAYEYCAQKHWTPSRRNIAGAATLLLVPAGFLLFQGYLWLNGLPLSSESNTLHWGIHWGFPWTSLWESIKLHAAGNAQLVDNLDLLSVMLFAGLSFPVWRYLRRSYGICMVAFLLLYLVRLGPDQPLMSMSRFVLVLFPAFILMARWGENRYFRWTYVILSATLLSLLVFLFTHWRFVG